MKGRKLDSLPLVSIVLCKPARTGLAVKNWLRVVINKLGWPEAGVRSRDVNSPGPLLRGNNNTGLISYHLK